jgi:16S rRNA (guanine527-N7)-methyltransferase
VRALGARYGLAPAQLRQLVRLLDVLERDTQAPTAVRDRDRALDTHVADSLAGLELAELKRARSVADLGSGAGLPGLVLAAALPDATFLLIESQARKCAFIARAVAAMGLDNASAVCVRAEEWEAGIGGCDVAVARALAPQPVVLEYAAPLLRIGGALVDWRGRRRPDEEAAAGRAATELGLGAARIEPVAAFPGAAEHHLHVFTKVADTPARFPRRAGVARKRPLAS